MIELLIVLGSFIFSFYLTGWIRKYALAHNVIDIPVERSSHEVPTPRGGGFSFVSSFYLALILFSVSGEIDQYLLTGLLAGIFVTLIGVIDDHIHVRARYRLLVHLLASLWVCYWIGIIPLPQWNDFYYLIFFVTALYLVWLINLYNFMDGIDGIASIEAMSVIASAGLLLYLNNSSDLLFLLAFFASIAAFLLWNWAPAKIFMGDGASGFLGIFLGTLSLYTANEGTLHFGIWLILMSVFITDATYTLLVRLFRGDKVYLAHRMHAYQILSRKYGHKRVAIGVLFVNVFWLLPIALLANHFEQFILAFIVIAWLPLIVTGVRVGAGIPDKHA